MKFKYRCFIENTEDSVKWLESIGYTRSLLCPKNDVIDCDILFTSIEEKTYYVTSIFSPVTTKYVDCRGNSPLFKALSAMREDSDYMQLFYIDVLCGIGGQMVGSEPKKRFWSICKDEKQKDQKKLKATLSELIAHFKVEH